MSNTNVKTTETSRVAEMVLGIMGSIFGMLGGIFAMFFGSLASAVEADTGTDVLGLGVAVIIVCIITLILSCIINKKRVLMGILLIIGGLLNIFFISMFGILSGLLIMVSGIIALIRK